MDQIDIIQLAQQLGVDFSRENFSSDDLLKGTRHELEEHADVLQNDPAKAAQIALDHLRERYDYYDAMDFFERSRKGVWKAQGKLIVVNIFVAAIIILAIIIITYYIVKHACECFNSLRGA